MSPLIESVEISEANTTNTDVDIAQPSRTVRFSLPFGGAINKVKAKWDRKIANRNLRAKQVAEEKLRNDVMTGQIPSAIADSGATSSCGKVGDPLIPTGIPSNKTFVMPNGEQTVASEQALLEHDVREPAKTVDMVPSLQNNTLLSTCKFADEGKLQFSQQMK